MGRSGRRRPAWFAAGLATLYRPRADLAALGLVRAALNDGATLPAETLAIDPPDDAPLNERALWEAQSAVLVRYLADRHGPDAPFEIARALAEGEPFEDALAALDETLPAALWDTWAAWAASDEAERAAVWTPYQSVAVAPTATPTRAPTATPPDGHADSGAVRHADRRAELHAYGPRQLRATGDRRTGADRAALDADEYRASAGQPAERDAACGAASCCRRRHAGARHAPDRRGGAAGIRRRAVCDRDRPAAPR